MGGEGGEKLRVEGLGFRVFVEGHDQKRKSEWYTNYPPL
jgi:hypothetical protein